MRIRLSLAVSVLALVAFVTPGCCAFCPKSCIEPIEDPSHVLTGPATGMGVVEIFRGAPLDPAHLVGYVTSDSTGKSYWLLKYNEPTPPVVPGDGQPNATYQYLNNDPIDTATWCGSYYADQLVVAGNRPKLWQLNPLPPMTCPPPK